MIETCFWISFMIIKLLLMEFGLDTKTTFAKLKLFQDSKPTGNKRKAKIFSHRLPQDFFGNRIYAQSEQKHRPTPRQTIQTQNIRRKATIIERISNTRDLNVREGSSSARTNKETSNAYKLMMGILQTTRQMNKSIDKHSMQLKSQLRKVHNPEFDTLELPPLRLKKGFSLN